MVIESERIRILPESMKLCQHFHIDPLGAIASGALLICVAPTDTSRLIDALRIENITASIIGRIEEKDYGATMKENGELRDLPQFERDEIAKVFES